MPVTGSAAQRLALASAEVVTGCHFIETTLTLQEVIYQPAGEGLNLGGMTFGSEAEQGGLTAPSWEEIPWSLVSSESW
jgi:hypothetical protein